MSSETSEYIPATLNMELFEGQRSGEPYPSNCNLEEPVTGHYFVSTYPPFSTWTKDQIGDVAGALFKTPAPPHDTPLGLYVHIPFCVDRCQYCYFLSHANRPRQEMDNYVDALIEELQLYRKTPALMDRDVAFVYFGGGTPSLLPAPTIERLMKGLQEAASWAKTEEVSFECAPSTATKARLKILKAYGVTRVSLGVQSLHDDVLRAHGRVHLLSDIERAYSLIRKIGFPIVNVDLMVGLAGETQTSFLAGVDRVINMAPESVTIYQLEIPHNTPLYRSVDTEESNESLIPWPEKRRRLDQAFARLESAGYHVRSGYAAVRDKDHHRFIYQDAQYHGADLLGLGAASFSYVQGVHFQNSSSIEEYGRLIGSGQPAVTRAYALRKEEQFIREFILQLKLGEIQLAYFLEKFGVDVAKQYKPILNELIEIGWLTRDATGFTLTRAGLLRVDRLLKLFYRSCHRHVRYA